MYGYDNESLPLRTKSSGLYRHREDLGLYKVGYKEMNLHIWLPSLPSTPRGVLSGHGCSLRSSYLHSPSVRPMANRPDARGPLNPGLPQQRLQAERDTLNDRWTNVLAAEEYGLARPIKSYPKRKLLPQFDDTNIIFSP